MRLSGRAGLNNAGRRRTLARGEYVSTPALVWGCRSWDSRAARGIVSSRASSRVSAFS